MEITPAPARAAGARAPRSSAIRDESERQRDEIVNAAKSEARELLATLEPRRDGRAARGRGAGEPPAGAGAPSGDRADQRRPGRGRADARMGPRSRPARSSARAQQGAEQLLYRGRPRLRTRWRRSSDAIVRAPREAPRRPRRAPRGPPSRRCAGLRRAAAYRRRAPEEARSRRTNVRGPPEPAAGAPEPEAGTRSSPPPVVRRPLAATTSCPRSSRRSPASEQGDDVS